MGLFYEFKDDQEVKMFGVEAAGHGLTTQEHAATLGVGDIGILHGAKSYLLQDENGQIKEAYSISAGLDYPGVGPEHAYLKKTGRAAYVSATDNEALKAFQLLSRTEGIIPALESAHALAYLPKLIPKTKKEEVVVVCLSGRGDKDTEVVIDKLGVE
jgi:tryptophan synthase beta chain